MDFNLSIPVRVISGKGCVVANSALLSPLGKACLIVTGGKSARLSGALDDVVKALEKENIRYAVYDKIGPNPLLSACFEGGKAAREIGADFIVGIGGGSPLDAAKAIAIYASNENLSQTDIYASQQRKMALPLVLVGTTAGTGSEVGKVAVLTNDETGRKKSISPDDCFPRLTFADASYTCSMPYGVTVSTALDALCHALEGYFSPKCGDIPTLFAQKAIPMIWQGLKELARTKQTPNEEMRTQLYYGSLYAGITLSYCGTAFPHPLGYVLTENYGTPHGFACAAFLPEFILRADRYESEKTKAVLSLIGETPESFCETVKALTPLDGICMTESELAAYCERWSETLPKNFLFSPGGFTKDDAFVVMKKFLRM